nr:DUF1998 domain-containing protein [Propionibacterium sp.]
MTTWLAGPNQLDPLGDAEQLKNAGGVKKNYAKVGSGRPSSLLFTYGPGAIMDLPHFTVMPSGLDAWEKIWARRDGTPHVHAPKLLDAVRKQLGPQVTELRPFPHQPETSSFGDEGRDLGVPSIVFPQWLRCTGCNRLAPLTTFEYRNSHPYRPDEARFEHVGCPGFSKTAKGGGKKRSLALPARYLLACTNGHLDEFPYALWVHHGKACPQAEVPHLRMLESTISRGASATIECASCGAKRGMNEAQGAAGKAKLPACRGRHPHLDAYATGGCDAGTHLMLIGASNLWFPILQRVIVMPMDAGERKQNLADRLKAALGDKVAKYGDDLDTLRDVAEGRIDLTEVSDAALADAVAAALAPPPPVAAEPADWSPIDLMVPEWNYLKLDAAGDHHEDPVSGLTVRNRALDPQLPPGISRVLAVEKLREATALLGFTRIDEMDRIDDLPARQAPLSLAAPTWVVATENRGEGIFLELAEDAVATWEAKVEASGLWQAHKEAHRRNFYNRMSQTATVVDPDSRLRPPRYWLLHTFAHVLFREMAMSSGYGAASISERIYAWQATDQHPPAAGVLLLTTSSDSDGTLGGLVQLSEPERLRRLINAALKRAFRCSSDPVCAHRTPHAPEDFLHGAACHCCTMASETSCERANRFLDRRFLLELPGPYADLGFFPVPP